jgi:integrase/recombinase XerD
MEKRAFYLTKRKLPSGKSVYYFYTYDKNGKRTVPQSTGCTKKTDAINYCNNLLLKHKLNINHIKLKDYVETMFGDNGFWATSGRLIKESSKLTYKSKIKPALDYFGNTNLDKISPSDILSFRNYLIEQRYKPASINQTVNLLKTVFNLAIADDFLFKNPVNIRIGSLKVKKTREAYTESEILYLLTKKWTNYDYFLLVLTLTLTGLRISECVGLEFKNLYNNYINVCQQYFNNKITSVKTQENRFVTIPEKLYKLLIENKGNSTFVFPNHLDGFRPVNKKVVRKELYKMFDEKMSEEQSSRELGFHSFRYFFNTYLVSQNIQKYKVDFVIGHSGGKGTMTKLYTTWKPEMFSDVIELQNQLIDKILENNVNLKT